MSNQPTQRNLSESWTLGAFSLTAPNANREEVVCNDDCENCPLYVGRPTGRKDEDGEEIRERACARGCNRWTDFVCQNCPCLGSRYVGLAWDPQAGVTRGEPRTVDPATNEPEPIEPILLEVRRQRHNLRDGAPCRVSPPKREVE